MVQKTVFYYFTTSSFLISLFHFLVLNVTPMSYPADVNQVALVQRFNSNNDT